MGKFTAENQPAKKGRKRGSKNIKQSITPEMEEQAKNVLLQALSDGEQWAVIEVLKRTAAPLKAVSSGVDAELVRLRCLEISELAQKVEQLESLMNES